MRFQLSQAKEKHEAAMQKKMDIERYQSEGRQALKQLHALSETLKTESSNAEQRMETLKTKASEVERHMKRLETKSSKAERRMETLKTKASKAERRMKRLKTEASKAEQRMQKLNTESSEAEQRIETLKVEASGIEQKMSATEQRLQQANAAHENARQYCVAISKEVESLQKGERERVSAEPSDVHQASKITDEADTSVAGNEDFSGITVHEGMDLHELFGAPPVDLMDTDLF